ncbi:MAG: ISNCY family transposase [Candidatus Krumholzibacteria bacterium]|nr:ISNCY family transposase [Candidatus Krumholzibacteria bacterium]
MRNKIPQQLPIVYPFIDHEHARELRRISDILDQMPEASSLVYDDLVAHGPLISTGRPGLSGDQALRLFLLKQMNGFSYEELAFHLADSRCYRAFCGFGIDEKSPGKSALQQNIKRIQPDTMELINRLVLEEARLKKVENGRKVRVDCTVVESNIHNPSDSSLLYDCVRVLARVMEDGRQQADTAFTNHTRRAKRRSLVILNAKTKKKRKKLYRDLLKVTGDTVVMAENMVHSGCDFVTRVQLLHFIRLAKMVITQTGRRVLQGESVPSSEKVVSIFEEHTDIIIKDRRDVYYGHKICLTSGKSGMFLDCVVEDGNPADSELACEMVDRQTVLYGRPPRQAAFDGGFASQGNLRKIKDTGVKDVMFSKKRGLKVVDMAKSTWVYKKLRNFRAGIEGMISFLKRCFGAGRCTWRGLSSFKSYVWGSVVSANLLILARHTME